ncbi:hypothetical protein [Microbispora sp. NPDC049633]|uniref:NACHT domain-containing protein n=1 Tax=Microbispora sp. NPDC049633 TaxID=3154355 RepID=UPI00342B8103
MKERGRGEAQLHPLHGELARLEEVVRRAGRYSRNKILDDIYKQGRGPKLSPQTVSGWIVRGIVPGDFADMWLFVRELLVRAVPDQLNNKFWWVRKESEWKGLWEAAKKQASHAAATRVATNDEKSSSGLLNFLSVTRLSAVEHPYPAALPGAVLPSLSQVYVRQQAETEKTRKPEADKDLDDSEVNWGKRPAEDVIKSRAPVAWLLGGPGAGKSSLLRMIAIFLAEYHLAEVSESAEAAQRSAAQRKSDAIQSSKLNAFPRRSAIYPIYMSAHFLVQPGSFAQQLHSAVQSQLRGHDYSPLSDEFFRMPPRKGARWLVLIDGLDEIADVDERIRVLQRLDSLKGGIYRFIVGSRPLPESELALLDGEIKLGRGAAIPGESERYELLPFDSAQLPQFVRGWMEAAQVHDPVDAIAAFMAQVNRGRLRELVRNPLMATILCQLHAANPNYPLPRGRYGAYQRFYDLLKDRFYDCSPAGINSQLASQLNRYGSQARNAISDLPGAILDVLGSLALRLQHERVSGSLELVKKYVSHLRPRDMPASRWESLMAQVLRRTGLVVVRGEELDFVHQTLREFLAAKHAAENRKRSEEEFLKLGKDGRHLPSYLTSYDRFLIAAWVLEDCAPRGLSELLMQLSTHYSSAAGISELIRDEVDLGSDIREATARTLYKMANGRNLSTTIAAAENLASVDISSAVEVLAVVLKNPRISFVDRALLSKKLIEFDPMRAVDTFAELAMTRRLNIMFRDYASDYLVGLDQGRAASVIADMIRERGGNFHELIVLSRKLARLDGALAANLLSSRIQTYNWSEKRRSLLVSELSEIRSLVVGV